MAEIDLSLFTLHFSLLLGWMLDLILGDPAKLPHPIVWFGKAIAFCEHRFNKGCHRKMKGALTALCLISIVFIATAFIRYIFYLLPSPFGKATGGRASLGMEGLGVRLIL